MSTVAIRDGKGAYHDACICDDNADIQSGCCSVGKQEDGSINKNDFCQYCYSKYLFKNHFEIKDPVTNESFLRLIKLRETKKTRILNTDYKIKTIRIGKNVDVWSVYDPTKSKETLLSVLKACNANKIQFILITKVMPFDVDVSNEIKKLNSTIHYSLGPEHWELGVVKQGMTNEKRVEEAEKYFQAGCNVYLRVTADVVDSPPEYVKNLKTEIPLLVTLMRYKSKQLFENEHTISWDEAKASDSYDYHGSALRPCKIHKDWNPDKTKFCGELGRQLLCNKCGLNV